MQDNPIHASNCLCLHCGCPSTKVKQYRCKLVTEKYCKPLSSRLKVDQD